MSLMDIICLLVRSDKPFGDFTTSNFLQMVERSNLWDKFKLMSVSLINVFFIIPVEDCPNMIVCTPDVVFKKIDEYALEYIKRTSQVNKSKKLIQLSSYLTCLAALDLNDPEIEKTVLK